MPSPKEHALTLLKRHREDIARTIARQVVLVGPSYANVDERVRAQSVLGILDLFAGVLGGADRQRLLALVKDLVALRYAGGVTPADFLAGAHVYLPVVRWVFVEEAADPLSGLWAFEEVEAVALPLLCRFGHVVLQIAEEATGAPPPDLDSAFEPLFTAADRFAPIADPTEL